MQTVILAAGDGGRLRPHTLRTPKPLLEVARRPIIAHTMSALLDAGVRDAVVVLGDRPSVMRRGIEACAPAGLDVRFVLNAAHASGNASSLWAVRDHVTGPFLLTMADHLIEPAVFAAVLTAGDRRCRLSVDRCERHDPRARDATRALVRDGRVVALGKRIRRWNALDTGAFYCSPRVFDAITPRRRSGELGAVFAALARAGELDAADVTGRLWIDIDTPEDLAFARATMSEAAGPSEERVDVA
jgi:choline kinase